MRHVHLAIGLLILGLAGSAAAQGDANSLRGKSRSVNDVRQQGAASLDESVVRNSDEVDGFRGNGSASIDQLRDQNKGWQPAECGPRPPAGVSLPPSGDPAAWEVALGEAEQGHTTSKSRWEQFESGAVIARPGPNDGGSQKAATARALEKARVGYSDSRCQLKTTLAGARRAGMNLSLLQPYVDRAPADLRPW
jgi:hypothetical protein